MMADELENDIRNAWDKVRDRFERVGPEQSLPGMWSQAVEELPALFATHVGPDSVADRFVVPQDYAAFMQMFGCGWRWEKWGQIYSSADMVRITGFDCKNCAGYRSDGDGIWLTIGEWGSKHDFLICCDCKHPLFGVVVEGEDAHPWFGYQAMWLLAPTFVGFLRDYLPGLTSRPSRIGSPLPVTEWLAEKAREMQ